MKSPIIAVFAMLLPFAAAWPQASTGTVSGTVNDLSGAVIPNAPVVLANTATRVSTPARTNDAGRFYFPGVTPGAYTISVEFPGMKKYQAAFTLQVQQGVVIDPVLTPGETTTVVEVKDVTPMIIADSPTIGHVLERERVEQLPITRRDLKVLLAVIPEVENVRAFGAPEGSMEFVLDGAPTINRRWGNHATMQGVLDSIQEFKVETNASSAKFSRPATVIMSTKSGTNEIHGSAFETLRNSGFGVARRRETSNARPAKLIRNEFGLSAGGPVYLPKLYNGKNRTFWFAAWEASRTVQEASQNFGVPTMAMRQGDFSQLRSSDGTSPVLYDPWSTGSKANNYARLPFSDGGIANKIPINRLSPVAKYLYSVTPAPTTADNPLVASNWFGVFKQWSKGANLSTRIDHRFTDRDGIYVRYSQSISRGRSPFGTLAALDGATGWTRSDVPTKTLSANYVRSFTPTLFNELNVSGYYNRYYNEPPVVAPPSGSTWQEYLGLPNPFNSRYFPMLQSTGIGSYTFRNNAPQNYHAAYIVVEDNATKLVGRHEVQFGFHYRYNQSNQFPQQWFPEGIHNASSAATALYDSTASTPTNPVPLGRTGHEQANLFIGTLNYENQMNRGWYNVRERDYALYLNDNYKLTSRLNLTLGLRWEYWPVLTEKGNVLATYDPASKSVVLGQTLETLYQRNITVPSVVARYQQLGAKFTDWKSANFPSTLMTGSKGDFGPRVGFAYRAFDGKKAFVIRGGYSLAYYPVPETRWMDYDRGNVPFNATFQFNMNSAAQTPDGLPNWTIRSTPSVIAGVNSRNVVTMDNPQGITRGAGGLQYFGPDQPTSRTHQWNLSLEKEIVAYTVGRVRYVGNHGGNLEQFYSYNNNASDYIWYVTRKVAKPTGEFAPVAMRPFDNTTFGTLSEFRKTGWSNYNGMMFEIERRYHKFAAFQLAYLIGNTLATTLSNQGSVAGVNEFLPGKVPEDYDARNRFLTYRRDTFPPKHRVKWNFLVDLPIGQGKPLFGNMHAVLDKIAGGWQLSGIGTIRGNHFALPTGIYPTTGNPIEIYGYQYPIQDCRSGVCQSGYLWWNGYIPSHQIDSVDAAGKPNGVMGVPANYKPAAQPLIPHNTPGYAANLQGSNTVWVPMANGSQQQVGFNDNLHPWRQQYLPANRQWVMDAGLVKNIPIGERLRCRFNIDFFNVFNTPGNPVMGSSQDGIMSIRTSGQEARTAQLSLRLSW
jgi:hypothetical protein